jgi:hypothetical protein
MKARLIACAVAALLLGGCSGRLDARKLLAKQAVATVKVKEAKAKFAAANVRFRASSQKQAEAAATNAKAGEAITLIVPLVDQLVLKVPPELKQEAELLKLRVDGLSAEIARTTGHLSEASAEMTAGRIDLDMGLTRIGEAEAAQTEINTKLGPEVMEAIAKLEEDYTNRGSALNKIAGFGGLVLAAFAALGSLKFTEAQQPQTWAVPAIVFATVYAASWVVVRFVL